MIGISLDWQPGWFVMQVIELDFLEWMDRTDGWFAILRRFQQYYSPKRKMGGL